MSSSALPPFDDEMDLDALVRRIPPHRHLPTTRDASTDVNTAERGLYDETENCDLSNLAADGRKVLQCCCGRVECAYLRSNCSALDDLEQDVRTAAQLGQALLVRHEAYMADAERERLDMGRKIGTLETAKRELEHANARTEEENRGLLNQLEEINTSVTESETQIRSLEATLNSANLELRRLEGLASRTHDLEAQLAALEMEQDQLQNTIILSEADHRSAIVRWKGAERGLNHLQEQLERIEREAQEERERHAEVLSRMERQRAVEKELDNAAGRLKGAAAVRTGSENGTAGGSNNVVTHFVKDILQDNANLQLGIMELREMLMSSNDEVQSLREQLLMHQPLVEEGVNHSAASTLRAELKGELAIEERETQVISQELHIHHHYHAQKKEEPRRSRKKRPSLSASIFTPPKPFSSARQNADMTGAILSQTAVTVPSPTRNNRWSMQSSTQLSDFTASSVPSSPQSVYRTSSLFDRGFDVDSSRPTSPGSSCDPLSPQFQPLRHRKRGSEVSARSFVGMSGFKTDHIIHEEDDNIEEIPELQISTVPGEDEETATPSDSNIAEEELAEDWITPPFSPAIRRSASHESILSISGIDIHTLKSRPSQAAFTLQGGLPRIAKPRAIGSVDTLTGSSIVTARPTLSRMTKDSTSYLRSSIAAHSTSPGNGARSITPKPSNEGLGKRMGGWVLGRWGMSPMPSSFSSLSTSPTLASASASLPTAGRRTASTPLNIPGLHTLSVPVLAPPALDNDQVSISSTNSIGSGGSGSSGGGLAPPDPLHMMFGRSPGVNQKGPILGFRKSERAPSRVRADIVDHEALREILEEGGTS